MNKEAKLGLLVSFPFMLSGLLVLLKVISLLHWPWWVVTSPIWIPAALSLYWATIFIAAARLVDIGGNTNGQEERKLFSMHR